MRFIRKFFKVSFFLLLPALALALVAGGLYLYMHKMPQEYVRHISAPTWGRPALVRPGGTFIVNLKCSSTPEIDKAILRNTRFPLDLEYFLKVEKIDFNKKNGTAAVTLRVPKIIPEFLYDFGVWFKDDAGIQNERQPSAVKVQAARNGVFTFAVLPRVLFHTDIDDPARRRREIKQLLDEINLLNPDFVVLTGGLAGGLWTASRDIDEVYGALDDELQVPMFIVPNEDDAGRFVLHGMMLRNGPRIWRRAIGDAHFRFDYQGFRFIGVNSFSCDHFVWDFFRRRVASGGCLDAAELGWLEAQLKSAVAKRLRPVLFLHHGPEVERWIDNQGRSTPMMMKQTRSKLLSLCKKYKVRAVFSGHVQRDSIHRMDDTLFVTTGAGTDLIRPEKPALRLITVTGGRFTYVNYIHDPQSLPLDKVTAIYRKPNDGKAARNSVTVTNELKRPLSHLSLVINMARKNDNSDYDVPKDVSSFQAFGRMSQFVFLMFDLKPGEKRTIEIK